MNTARATKSHSSQGTGSAQPQSSHETTRIVDQFGKVSTEVGHAQLNPDELKNAVDFFKILDAIDQRLRKTPK